VLEEALEHLVKGIVDHDDEVVVRRKELRRGEVLEVRVHPDDLGRVIGRSGRTASALRTVMGALAGGQHGRQRGVRQLHHGGDVHVELGLQHRKVGRPEFARRTEPGVVHQNPHPGRQPVGHLRAVGFVGQVGDQHLHPGAGLVAQFGAEALQPIGVAGHQDQVVAVDGVAAGESRAQPGRRSGDQCDGAWHALEST